LAGASFAAAGLRGPQGYGANFGPGICSPLIIHHTPSSSSLMMLLLAVLAVIVLHGDRLLASVLPDATQFVSA